MQKNLNTIGDVGSENGKIIIDEEYMDSCRITLEKCSKYYAITCGVYGGMVHTTFCNNDEYNEKYAQMKSELQKFVDSGMNNKDEFYDEFTSKY